MSWRDEATQVDPSSWRSEAIDQSPAAKRARMLEARKNATIAATDPAVFESGALSPDVARKVFSNADTRTSLGDRIAHGALGAADSLDALGIADEARGVGRALIESQKRLLSFNPMSFEELGATYAGGRDEQREASEEAQERSPLAYGTAHSVSTMGAGLAGLGSSVGRAGVQAGAKTLTGSGKLAALLRGAKSGAGFGGASGFGHAKGDLEEQAIDTGVGALAGAGLGAGVAALPIAAQGVGRGSMLLGKAIGRGVGSAVQKAAPFAQKVVDVADDNPLARSILGAATLGQSELGLGAAKLMTKAAGKMKPPPGAPPDWLDTAVGGFSDNAGAAPMPAPFSPSPAGGRPVRFTDPVDDVAPGIGDRLREQVGRPLVAPLSDTAAATGAPRAGRTEMPLDVMAGGPPAAASTVPGGAVARLQALVGGGAPRGTPQPAASPVPMGPPPTARLERASAPNARAEADMMMAESSIPRAQAVAAGASTARKTTADKFAAQVAALPPEQRGPFLQELAQRAGPKMALLVAKRAGVSTKLLGLEAK